MPEKRSLLTAAGGFLLALFVLGSSQLVAAPRQASARTAAGLSLQSREDALERTLLQGWSQVTAAEVYGPGLVDQVGAPGPGTFFSHQGVLEEAQLQVHNLGDVEIELRTTGGLPLGNVPPGNTLALRRGSALDPFLPDGQELEYNTFGGPGRVRFVWRVTL